MAYTKTTWVNGTTPAINKANLDNLETQCDEAVSIMGGDPSGRIMIWTGTIGNIPAGWYLCDGNNSTPDLTDRFLLCVADAITNPGTTGGATAKTTTGHYHAQKMHSAGGVTGTGTTSVATDGSGGYDEAIENYGGAGTMTAVKTGTQSKTDSISDIRPKYIEVAFIMKS